MIHVCCPHKYLVNKVDQLKISSNLNKIMVIRGRAKLRNLSQIWEEGAKFSTNWVKISQKSNAFRNQFISLERIPRVR